MAKAWFYFSVLFVVLASLFDAYLNYFIWPVDVVREENPIARCILAQSNLEILMVSKLVGTFLVFIALILIWRYNPRIGCLVASGVAAFQLWVVLYLLW